MAITTSYIQSWILLVDESREMIRKILKILNPGSRWSDIDPGSRESVTCAYLDKYLCGLEIISNHNIRITRLSISDFDSHPPTQMKIINMRIILESVTEPSWKYPDWFRAS